VLFCPKATRHRLRSFLFMGHSIHCFATTMVCHLVAAPIASLPHGERGLSTATNLT